MFAGPKVPAFVVVVKVMLPEFVVVKTDILVRSVEKQTPNQNHPIPIPIPSQTCVLNTIKMILVMSQKDMVNVK
jgi:hypothetical protein